MIVGVDLSTTRLDFALINPHGDIAAMHSRMIVVPDGSSEAYRAREATAVARRIIWPIPELYAVVIERPIGAFGTAKLSAIFGAVAAAVPTHASVVERKATEWRVLLGLPARAPKGSPKGWIKERTIEWVEQHTGIPGLDEHEADAIGIGLAYHHQCLSVTTDR